MATIEAIMRTSISTVKIVNFLLGNTRAAVLRTLLLEPDAALHVRELARVTGASPGSLHRDLRTLTELGLLQREEVGRQVHYRANRECGSFNALVDLLSNADAATTTQSRQPAVAPVLHSPQAEYHVVPHTKLHIPRGRLAALCRKYKIHKLSLFGSAARNELTPESDIDLLVEFSPQSDVSLLVIPALQEELSALFGGRTVDVATPEILDNPFRRDAILAELRTLYAA
jgi:predicted nucleotidyltransferase/DNA-binding HxlR family transcriptional regulator